MKLYIDNNQKNMVIYLCTSVDGTGVDRKFNK